LLETAVGLLKAALERVAAGDPGDPQPEEGATWAGHFEDDEYVRIDWSQPARAIHNQVRAWQMTFGMSGLRAPVAELDGEEVVVLQTRLTDPGNDARRVECGDGPIWVVATEPV
jgi:methionyl-tRNA formyltransferase